MTGFWRGKKVFVTGHTGFKGAWLSLWLQQKEAEVTGYSLPPPTEPSMFEVADVARGMRSIVGDIRDVNGLNTAMADAAPEIVVHMAAQPLVRRSYADPVETYSTNVMGTVNLLEAVRRVKSVRAVVNVTSDKCYDNREWLWGYRENEPLGGFDPYSSSKACAELVTAAYRNSYFGGEGQVNGPLIATARAGNVIGGGDWAQDRLVPDIISAFSAQRPVIIRNPDAVRPWQHVLEPLSGYMKLVQKLHEQGAAYADAWNFGPADDDARTVRWIVEHLVQGWGEGAAWQPDQVAQPHEAHALRLDSSKAHTRLGWRPQWALGEGLARTVAWHRAHAAGADMRAFSLEQITDFEEQMTL